LELLQTLWQLHPNARLRRALKARILRARSEGEVIVVRQPLAAGETA